MLDVVKTKGKDGKLWIEDDFGTVPYQIEINGTIWTRIYLTSVGNTTEDGKFIPYECINILGYQHKLDEVYTNIQGKTKSLREILIHNKML